MTADQTTPGTESPIYTDADYRAGLLEYEGYFDNEPASGTREAARFVALGIVLADYAAREVSR